MSSETGRYRVRRVKQESMRKLYDALPWEQKCDRKAASNTEAQLPTRVLEETNVDNKDIVGANQKKSAEDSVRGQIRQWLRKCTPAFPSQNYYSSPAYVQEISGRPAEQMREAAPAVLLLAVALLRHHESLKKIT